MWRKTLSEEVASAIDSRTARHAGYAISQKKRKRIEECFGWLKTIVLLRKVRHRGTLKVDWIFTFACAAQSGAHAEPDAQRSSDVVKDRAAVSLNGLQRFFGALGSTKNHTSDAQKSRMTQTNTEIAGSERFSRSLLEQCRRLKALLADARKASNSIAFAHRIAEIKRLAKTLAGTGPRRSAFVLWADLKKADDGNGSAIARR